MRTKSKAKQNKKSFFLFAPPKKNVRKKPHWERNSNNAKRTSLLYIKKEYTYVHTKNTVCHHVLKTGQKKTSELGANEMMISGKKERKKI